MNPWHEPPDYPKPGDEIIAELAGCKVCDYMRFTVREGEGLEHIKRWQLLPQILRDKDERERND